MRKDHLLFNITCLALILAFCVVILGAYTRLKDAGLGCPDWPGCYGHFIVPKGETAKTAEVVFGVAIEAPKAWAEMIHRYFAGILGLLILFIMIRTILTRKTYQTPITFPIFLVLIVIMQASLGRWTVTLKLSPLIVMLHLLGGMMLVVLLSLLALRLRDYLESVKALDTQRFRFWVLLGLILLILQIILGGWTSANYASLACMDFPYCNGSLIPSLDFSHAFSLINTIGLNYQGGLLDQTSKITIQMCHRFGAFIVFIYWLILCLWMLRFAQSKVILRFSVIILILLIFQMSLGIMNLVFILPLPIAVSHNAVATLLLVSVVALNDTLYFRRDTSQAILKNNSAS